MKSFIWITLMFLFFGNSAFGQGIDNTFYDEVWSVKVKQIDDFMDRFNNEINFLKNGSRVKNKFSPDTRPKLLSSLINYEKIKDQALIDSFIQHIDKENHYLKLGLGDIRCMLNVEAQFKQKKFDLLLELRIYVLSNGSMKWIISDANANSYPWNKIAQNPNNFINPSNHNLRFSNLFKFINEGNDIKGIFSDNFQLDNFSIMVHEFMEGNLQIKEIKDINYKIYINEEIRFMVSYFDKPSKPSGWLISEILN